MKKYIELIGFGSQGAAWAQCLRKSGWEITLFLSREGPTYHKARDLGFNVQLLQTMTKQSSEPHSSTSSLRLVAFLCPDAEIGSVYRDYFAQHDGTLLMILAHGYTVFANELKPESPNHFLALLAPKTIGPELLNAFRDAFPNPHSLSAAFHAPTLYQDIVKNLAFGLGFSEANLIPATFFQETVGDLISEQGLLCGGIFTLLEWTVEAMVQAGIPDALIREECLTELELIARMLRTRGPSATLRSISQTAQAGMVGMQNALNQSSAKQAFQTQLRAILDGVFVGKVKTSDWRTLLNETVNRLEVWEKRIQPVVQQGG